MSSKLTRALCLVAALVVAGESVAAESSPRVQRPDWYKPYFIGKLNARLAPAAMSMAPVVSQVYMTAKEMQETAQSVTGFFHPAFDSFADALGRYDSATGRRTTDRPSLISVFFLQQVSVTIAGYVINRELFFDDDERIVFQGVDLERAPSDVELGSFIEEFYGRWLATAPDADSAALLVADFRRVETASGTAKAYERLLSLLLQHGGLYYY